MASAQFSNRSEKKKESSMKRNPGRIPTITNRPSLKWVAGEMLRASPLLPSPLSLLLEGRVIRHLGASQRRSCCQRVGGRRGGETEPPLTHFSPIETTFSCPVNIGFAKFQSAARTPVRITSMMDMVHGTWYMVHDCV